jgi:hypothetical protein
MGRINIDTHINATIFSALIAAPTDSSLRDIVLAEFSPTKACD